MQSNSGFYQPWISKAGIALAAIMLLQPVSLLAEAKTPKQEKASLTVMADVDTSYAYVNRVFEKLQAHWEPPAYEQTISGAVLTFTLDDKGTLVRSSIRSSNPDSDFAKQTLDYLKRSAPFGRFPEMLQGNLLEFKFNLNPSSIQMAGYEVLDGKEKNSVITYNAPIGNTAGASLFYMSAQQPLNAGVSWKEDKDKTGLTAEDEQAMNEYITTIQDQIQQKWHLPEGQVSSERAVALLMVDRDGSLLSATLKQSSGNKIIDKAALNAIMQSAPFAHVPASAQSLPVEIEYVFERVAPEPSDIDVD